MMRLTITLSEEQVNKAIHYGKTKSITSACNLAQSITSACNLAQSIASTIEELEDN